MSANFFRPPNNKSLSDNVIGDVIQRARSSRSEDTSLLSYQERQSPQDFILSSSTSKSRDRFPINACGRIDPTPDKLLPNANREIAPYHCDRMRTQDSKRNGEVLEETLAKVNRDAVVRARENHRRESCRKNQARYRRRQRKRLEGLEEDIRGLHHEIYNLKKKRISLPLNIYRKHNVWTFATEYLHLFRHGLSSSSTAQHKAILEFLQVTMAPDVRCGDEKGVEALMKSWELFSTFFESVDIKLECLVKDIGDSLVATTTTSVTISENTLPYVFPHLKRDENGGANGGEWSALAAKLLDQRVLIRGSIHFDWDSSMECVVRMQSQLDLLTPALQLLGNLEDVSRVFMGALITLDGRVLRGETP